MRSIAIALSLVLIFAFCAASIAQEAKTVPTAPTAERRTTVSFSDLKPEDQAKVKSIEEQALGLRKDVDLAQAKIDLAQAKITRINEVQIPALIAELRKIYNLPEAEWNFDLKSIAFIRKEAQPPNK